MSEPKEFQELTIKDLVLYVDQDGNYFKLEVEGVSKDEIDSSYVVVKTRKGNFTLNKNRYCHEEAGGFKITIDNDKWRDWISSRVMKQIKEEQGKIEDAEKRISTLRKLIHKT